MAHGIPNNTLVGRPRLVLGVATFGFFVFFNFFELFKFVLIKNRKKETSRAGRVGRKAGKQAGKHAGRQVGRLTVRAG